ncbi:MAG: tRNA (adenosine(37)-N6)-threonylcarbamoyltransferase complex ATPase subunit type 1 TsaE [Chitinophagaceae bacterium]
MVYQLAAIQQVVAQVWKEGSHQKIWLFKAEMGSGKTTFIHALCNYLQVTDMVSSPTFSIINEYKSEQIGSIYHMDWYRLKNAQEAIDAGVEDILLQNVFCFIEWPEKAPEIIPDSFFTIELQFISTNERRVVTY